MTNQLSIKIDQLQPYMHAPMIKEIKKVADNYGAMAHVIDTRQEKLLWRNGILATASGEEIVLSGIYKGIFAILADNPNQQLSYEEIVERLDAQSLPATSRTNFRVVLHRLRKQLRGNGHLIQTERDNGYLLRVDNDLLTIG